MTTKTQQHTPTPWKIGSFGVIYSGELETTEPVLDKGHARHICEMVDWRNQKEDISFLLQAVNNYDEMLKALKWAELEIRQSCDLPGPDGMSVAPDSILRVKLAKLQGIIAQAEGK